VCAAVCIVCVCVHAHLRVCVCVRVYVCTRLQGAKLQKLLSKTALKWKLHPWSRYSFQRQTLLASLCESAGTARYTSQTLLVFFCEPASFTILCAYVGSGHVNVSSLCFCESVSRYSLLRLSNFASVVVSASLTILCACVGSGHVNVCECTLMFGIVSSQAPLTCVVGREGEKHRPCAPPAPCNIADILSLNVERPCCCCCCCCC